MELSKNIEQQLAELLEDPQKVSAEHTAMLNELLEEYPYYQPLHLLLAKANQHAANSSDLAKASLYSNGQLLHQFLFTKEKVVSNFQVIGKPEETEEPKLTQQQDPEQQSDTEQQSELTEQSETIEQPQLKENPQQQEQPEMEVEPELEEQPGTAAHPEEKSIPEEQYVADEQETFEEISEFVTVAPVTADHKEIETVEEDVFEEIAEVDISNYRPFRNSDQPEGAAKTQPVQEHPIERRHTTEDELVFESIVSSDFFAFEQSGSTIVPAAAQQEKPPFTVPVIEEHDEAAAAESEKSRVSNYHDDKLPYTFLWWLAKTRKEHQNTIQPYAVPKKKVSQELQQQYVEHIFHMQSHLTGSEELLNSAEQIKPASKDFEIIESFIRNDPQIHPPNAEQIDNENKAKKSAEDQNDLVSETLANIYIEQMLYDKAIETYEKLSLKFPEKRRYFADLIQSIEKKI